MPTSAPHPCAVPGCPELIPRGRARCDGHERRAQKLDRDLRGSAAERGYDRRWQSYREAFLRVSPLCVLCLAENPSRVTAATVVDHVKAHKGDRVLFWEPTNHRAVCKPHHDARVDEGDFGRTHG